MEEQEKQPCVSCGALVSGPTQEYPYHGHKVSCKLTAEWRKAQEDVITETLEIRTILATTLR